MSFPIPPPLGGGPRLEDIFIEVKRGHYQRGTTAAHRDYSDGFPAEIRYLVRAELLDDFLTQADLLHSQGYHIPAASLAGAVLEDTPRKLCDKHSVSYDPAKTSIEALNMELARAEVYDKLAQKEITAKADLRNSAGHGHSDKVRPPDVEDMLRWVRRFASERLRQI